MTITLEQWRQHPSFQTELAELLKHPALAVALDLVRHRGAHKLLTSVGTASLIDYYGLIGAHREGYTSSLDDLIMLSKPTDTRPPEEMPWKSKPAEPDGDRTSAP